MIELLVSIAIVVVLVGLALPAVQRLRESADSTECRNQIRQLAMTVHAYHGDRQSMPPYMSGRQGEVFGSWFVHLLPYTEYAAVHEQMMAWEPSPHDSVRLGLMSIHAPGVGDVEFPMLLCPADPTRQASTDAGKTNYLANWYAFGNGSGGAYTPRQRFADLTDGLSNVILFGEGYTICAGLPRYALQSAYYHNFGLTQQGKPSDDPSYAPHDYTLFQISPEHCDHWRTQTGHRAMNVALADGSARPVNPAISLETWKHLLKPRDGVAVTEDW